MSKKSSAIIRAAKEGFLTYTDSDSVGFAAYHHFEDNILLIQSKNLFYKKNATAVTAPITFANLYDKVDMDVESVGDHIPPWVSGTSYDSDDIIAYNGDAYAALISLPNNTVAPTGTDSDTNWVQITDADTPATHYWVSTHPYANDDITGREGLLMSSLTNSNQNNVPVTGYIAGTTPTHVAKYLNGTGASQIFRESWVSPDSETMYWSFGSDSDNLTKLYFPGRWETDFNYNWKNSTTNWQESLVRGATLITEHLAQAHDSEGATTVARSQYKFVRTTTGLPFTFADFNDNTRINSGFTFGIDASVANGGTGLPVILSDPTTGTPAVTS